MLVDIFARRYANVVLRNTFEERDRRLLVQSFRILAEDIFPYYQNGKEDNHSVAILTKLHNVLSRELGVKELSPQWFSYTTKWNGSDHIQTHNHTLVKVCENWFEQPVSATPDNYIKEQLSFIELGFREREREIQIENASPILTSGQMLAGVLRSPPRNLEQTIGEEQQRRTQKTTGFRNFVEELNVRFRQAGYSLNYHNQFIQLLTDDLIQREVENPFWDLVSAEKWANVEIDMKQALDLRDADGRDPAFYAARSLESTIKIVSDTKGWTRGAERGAHNYIDNLSAKGNNLIAQWESASLKEFFTQVRNPFGHGPGNDVMPILSRPQTEWAIEFSMIWIKNLIRRL